VTDLDETEPAESQSRMLVEPRVEPTTKPGTPLEVRRVAATRPRLRNVGTPEPRRSGGMWIVIVAYIVAAVALGLTIYLRFMV
jgi:hypothetical protein